MKYFKLIRRNLFRNPLRAVLTLALIAFIFFFVSTLLSILQLFDRFEDQGQGANRLVVQSSISLANALPYAHEQKLREIPGVEDVCKMQWIGAYYKDKKNFFANFAVDHDRMGSVFDDYKIDPQQMKDFQNDRQGCIVGPDLMKRFGWKIGDRITLKRQIFPYDPELTIRGVYHHPVNTAALYYHMDYHQLLMNNFGQVNTFWIKIKDPSKMAAISQQIDAMFKNSEYPTETVTEKQFQASFMAMMGNIKLLFGSICTCAVFMVILLAAITMSMSARERVTEIAVLKAIGFERPLVMTLMLTEFALLTLLGGALGVFGAKLLYMIVPMGQITQGFLVGFTIFPATMLIALAASGLVGLIAGGLPAINATRMSVVDGLRRVV
ncbi:MAG TPA: ABC transporter permease [Thermoanaerobaculia bacterium]|nr:ABC transporter permease [Thermoanaerobaculia bacterium]